MVPNTTWLRPLTRQPSDGGGSDTIVFAFPPAGAGPTIFRRWLGYLPAGVELVAVNAPGREDRIREVPATHADELVEHIAAAMVAYAARTDRPFAIFGHSMGALLGRAVAGRVAAHGLVLLVAAGAPPPHQPVESLADASAGEIAALLAEWGGTPAAVLADPTVFEVFLPGLRADFAVADSCRRPVTPDQVLDVPIVALAGSADRVARPADCTQWSVWTRRWFRSHVVTGGHFFPFTAAKDVAALVGSYLSSRVGHRG